MQALQKSVPSHSVTTSISQITKKLNDNKASGQLNGVLQWLRDDLNTIDTLLASLARDSAAPAQYLLEQPGKRIRPLCLILAAKMCGRHCDELVTNLAVAAEFVHTATLLHDDVIDEASERRGSPSAPVVFGNSASLLAGDHLLVTALDLVRSTKLDSVLGKLLDTIGQMVQAEISQLEGRGRINPEPQTSLAIIDGKTASFFEWCLATGAVSAGADSRLVSDLGQAGHSMGRAFQLVDDIIDITADPADSGKDRLADLKQGKITWPLIEALQIDPTLSQDLTNLLSPGTADPGQLAKVMEKVRATGAVESTRSFASSETEKALRLFRNFPENPATDALESVVKAIAHRMF